MHVCLDPDCGAVCDCDGDDTWSDIPPMGCVCPWCAWKTEMETKKETIDAYGAQTRPDATDP